MTKSKPVIWTPAQVRKTLMFVGMMALAGYLIITGSTTDAAVGVMSGLMGALQAFSD